MKTLIVKCKVLKRQNPHIHPETCTQYSSKLPLLLNTNLTAEVYLGLLENAIELLIPEILKDNPNEFGVPAHYYSPVERCME